MRALLTLFALCWATSAGARLVDYPYDPTALPKPILDGREDWIELYYKAWDLAADNINFAATSTGLVAEYMDEALTDSKVWQWDTLFIAMFAKYSNGELPIMNGVDNFYRKQRSDGFICRELSEHDGTDIYPNSAQPWPVSNPNPPLYSWAEWDYYLVTGDSSRFTKTVTSTRNDEDPRTKTVLQRLYDYHFWIKNNIRHADGHYRSDEWANGMDDTPRIHITMQGAWMDLAAQQALSALYLAKMAAVAGDETKRQTLLAEYRQHKDLVNNSYWHETDKLYYDLDSRRAVYKTKTVATFWPLIAEITSRRQADHLVHHLVDFNEFWRPLLVPTLAADHPAYTVTGEYWKGASWPPTTYMVARGLAAQGYWPLVRTVAENYVAGLAALHQSTGTIWENSAPEIVAPSNDSVPHFVGWGGLGPIAMLIEHILGINLNAPAGTVEWRLGQAARNGVENLGYRGGKIVRMVSAARANADAPATVAIETTVPFTLTLWIGDRSFTQQVAAGPERTYRFGFDNHAPTANPNGPYRLQQGLEVAFSSAGSVDQDGRIASYHWDFGDSATSTEANPTHRYATSSNYAVSLTVTDDDGASARAQTLVSSGRPEPTPAFYGDRIRPQYGGCVRFRDQSLHAPNRWRWSFPGGEPASSAERAPLVRYPTAGEYDVSLAVGNAYGESAKFYPNYVDVLGDIPKDYCYAASGRTIYSYISRVSVGPLDSRTGSNGYSLSTSTARIVAGSTQTLRVVANVFNPVGGDRNLVRAWVDWNGDRRFDDDERLMNEAIVLSSNPIEVSQSFTVPSGVAGVRRLRVKVNYDEGPLHDFGACFAFESGEAEDYEIDVIGRPALRLSGRPAPSVSSPPLAVQDGSCGVAPSYSGISVTDKTYLHGTAIQPFRIPLPTGGDGAYDYTVTGLPNGLVFDEDGTADCMAVRTVCGTPSVAATTMATATVTVVDGAPDMTPGNSASLTFTVTVRRQGISVSPQRLALTEGASSTYAVVLAAPPTASVTVAVASGNAAIAVDADTTPLARTLTFTTQNWDTAQSVTVRALGDADAIDEAATITNTASSSGDSSYNGLGARVRAVVDDDEATGTDYDADNDRLIEIDSLPKLNAVRWDLDGDGAVSSGDETNYRSAFAGSVAAEHMGCPDTDADPGGDCGGYELTADLDFDTDGSGGTWTASGGTVTGDANDTYNNGGNGWDPIGPATAAATSTHFNATFDGNGHVIDNLFVNRTRNRAGLFAGTNEAATIVALGLPDAWVAGATHVGALAGELNGRIAGVWVSGEVSASNYVGGLAGAGNATTSRIVASYSTAAVNCASGTSNHVGGGLVSHTVGQVAASYSTGTVAGDCPIKRGLLNLGSGSGTVTASYWDADLSAIADDGDSNAPEGKSTAALQAPTSYGADADPNAIYRAWDDQDVDGDGVAGNGDDGDPWYFGPSNQHPILKYRRLAVTRQLDAQRDTAPAFATSTLAARTFQRGWAIQAFQVPAATGGNGALRYVVRGLPTGLAFDADGSGSSCAGNAPRMVCGIPLAATTTTATIAVQDSDSNTNPTDQDTLTFAVSVTAQRARILLPVALAEATLNNAAVTVGLTDTTFETSVATSSFALTVNPPLTGLSVASAAVAKTSAKLTLSYSGGDFNTVRTLSVTVADAAHTLAGALTTETVDIVPTPSVAVAPTSLTLIEGGASGTYSVALGGQPTGSVAVTATSDDASVAIDTDATPRTRTLTFTPENWNTPQTVTVAPQDDDTADDETATISHAVSPNYGAVAASVNVTVADDETRRIVIDADPSTTVVDDGPLALQEDAMGVGNSASYSVKLGAVPTATTTVTIASADTAAVTVDDTDGLTPGTQNMLSFTTGNWATAQTVTLRAVQDADPNNEEVAIDHAAADGGYTGVAARLTATVADDDVGVIVDTDPIAPGDQLTPLALEELTSSSNNQRMYTVRLSTLPIATTTVAVASDNGAIGVAAGASGGTFGSAANLTFTTGNWATAQTVRARAEQDSDRVGERGTISNDPSGAQYGSAATIHIAATAQDDEMTGTDYDADDDGLIEVATLARLHAMRWDLDGDGSSTSEAGYRAAFAGSVLAEDMGCLDGPDSNDDGDCAGYELARDIDFDTDQDGDVDADDAIANWAPIGTSSAPFDTVLKGNGHVVSNLRADRPGQAHQGFFAHTSPGSRVESLGLRDAYVRGADWVGILAADPRGTIDAVWTSGAAVGVNGVGGVAGRLRGRLRAGYSTASVTQSTGTAGGGGLVGVNGWATGARAAPGHIVASYSTGAVAGPGGGGLAGASGHASSTVAASYWDTQASGVATSAGGTGATTVALQTPTSATGTYASWNDIDLDSDGEGDAAWDFGTAHNYPALQYGGMDRGRSATTTTPTATG